MLPTFRASRERGAVQCAAGSRRRNLRYFCSLRQTMNQHHRCDYGPQTGCGHVVARVRSPEYSEQMNFLRESLGISLILNPELETALEISLMLQFSTALNIEHFDRARVLIVETKLQEESPLIGKSLRAIGRNYGDVLVSIVERSDSVTIPSGDFVLRAGDRLRVAGPPEEIRMFCSGGIRRPQRIRSALIVGGGRLTRYLLKRIQPLGIRCKVIEADEERADDLAADFPWVEVICGDGTSQNFLKEERLSRFDAVVALTGIDEENLLISIFAGRVGVKKTVTKVNRTDLLQVLDNVGLQAIVTPKQVVADHIVRFVRSVQNSAGNHLEAFYRVADGRAEVLEFQIGPGALCRDIPLSELQTKPNLLITAIIRGEQIIFPAGQDTIRSGDRVIVVTTQQHFQDINDILL